MNEVSVGKETRVIKYNQEKGKKMKETVSSVVTLEEWFASQKHLLEHRYVFVVRGLSNSLSGRVACFWEIFTWLYLYGGGTL